MADTAKRILPWSPGQTLEVKDFGPIRDAKVTLGDVTVLIGPNATGKSVFLQLLALAFDDLGYYDAVMDANGLRLSEDPRTRLCDFLGWDGWPKRARAPRILLNGEACFEDLLSRSFQGHDFFYLEDSKTFYIPASRSSVMRNGWPRSFSDFAPEDPVVLRVFSNDLREAMEFPEFVEGSAGRSYYVARSKLERELYGSFRLDVSTGRRVEVVLKSTTGWSIPYSTWSTGQREASPLLALLDRALRNRSVYSLVVEEPELGLHPKALSAAIRLILESLRSPDYSGERTRRLVISTHSPVVLDYIWAIRFLSKSGGEPSDVAALFGDPESGNLLQLGEILLKLDFRSYLFSGQPSTSTEISDLDPFSDRPEEAGWGGLLDGNTRIVDVVTQVANRRGNP